MDYLHINLAAACKGGILLAAALAYTGISHAAPLLTCKVSYAGTTHTIQTYPVSDPYPVESVDIGGRFRFKAVMVGTPARVDYVSLYAYLETRTQPVLVQQAKYLQPFRRSTKPYLLTGQQFVYAGPVERELTYSCTLEGTP